MNNNTKQPPKLQYGEETILFLITVSQDMFGGKVSNCHVCLESLTEKQVEKLEDLKNVLYDIKFNGFFIVIITKKRFDVQGLTYILSEKTKKNISKLIDDLVKDLKDL